MNVADLNPDGNLNFPPTKRPNSFVCRSISSLKPSKPKSDKRPTRVIPSIRSNEKFTRLSSASAVDLLVRLPGSHVFAGLLAKAQPRIFSTHGFIVYNLARARHRLAMSNV